MLNFKVTKNVFIYTYGCQMNVHDTEKIRGVLSVSGYKSVDNAEDADLIVFNTCAIREKAEQKFYSQLGRIKLLKKKRHNLKIAVGGCVAQEAKDKLLKKAPFVDFVFGPQNIHRIGDILHQDRRCALHEDNDQLAQNDLITLRQSSLKAWVSINYGCNNFCSYCIVPYTRGREVSRPSGSILSEIRDLKIKGYKEITLLGQNVNSYRSDISFTELLKKIDLLNIDRVRFVTSHPRDFSRDVMISMCELTSLCEHIHLPLQSGSDKVLKSMNRGYTFLEYMKKIATLRGILPSVAITTDIIVGFPGETEEDFLMTVEAVKEMEYDGIFAFKYSPRPGTKAFELDNIISDEIKSTRLDFLLKTQEEITYRKNQALEGTIQEILLEGPSETDASLFTGRTRTNKIVNFPVSDHCIGSLVNVTIQKAALHSLFAVALP